MIPLVILVFVYAVIFHTIASTTRYFAFYFEWIGIFSLRLQRRRSASFWAEPLRRWRAIRQEHSLPFVINGRRRKQQRILARTFCSVPRWNCCASRSLSCRRSSSAGRPTISWWSPSSSSNRMSKCVLFHPHPEIHKSRCTSSFFSLFRL